MSGHEPIDPSEAVGQQRAVEARCVSGETHGVGRVVAYCDAPTYVIERPDGSRFSWRADMTYALADESADIAAATARAQAAIHQQLDNA
jgi:hypothetical protein